MPGPSFWYDCPCGGFGSNQPNCWNCGTPGRYRGYTKGTYEHWDTFARITGLKPLGDKSSAEAQAILERVVRCTLCGGNGYLSDHPDYYAKCPRCLGDGKALDGRFRGGA